MFITLAYIAVFLVCCYGVYKIDKRSASLSKSVFIAIFLGALLGLSLHLLPMEHNQSVIEWYDVVGTAM
jgi:hypothetical protein